MFTMRGEPIPENLRDGRKLSMSSPKVFAEDMHADHQSHIELDDMIEPSERRRNAAPQIDMTSESDKEDR